MRNQVKMLSRFVMAVVLLCWWSVAFAIPPIPTGPLNPDGTPAVPDYNTTPNWAFSPPLAKFVDTLPRLLAPNNIGAQFLLCHGPICISVSRET